MKAVINYFDKKKLISSVDEAVEFINNLKHKKYGHPIEANEWINRYLQEWFTSENPSSKLNLATTGCGETRIEIMASVGNTIEEHEAEITKKKEAYSEARRLSLKKKEDDMQIRNKGWYIVELPCHIDDLNRGGSTERYTNWKILADSPMDAYNKACSAAGKKGLYWFASPVSCQIEFWGEWNDAKQNALMDAGLI